MQAQRSITDSRRGLVLVVDDDRKFARIVVRFLERAGYQCLTAESGTQALLATHEQQPDAIVLDVMIPPPDGIEVCRELRAEGWTGGVVMVSARSSPADRSTAVAAGADAFLGKPFPLNDLVSAVDAFAGRTA